MKRNWSRFYLPRREEEGEGGVRVSHVGNKDGSARCRVHPGTLIGTTRVKGVKVRVWSLTRGDTPSVYYVFLGSLGYTKWGHNFGRSVVQKKCSFGSLGLSTHCTV